LRSQDSGDYTATTFDLKKEAVRGTTVEVVPEQAFLLFKTWFACSAWSKPILRHVVEVDGKLDVEMNPLTFTMCTCGHDGEPRITKTLMQVSRALSVADLLPKAVDAVVERYANDPVDEKIRKVWYTNDSNLWILLGLEKEVGEGTPKFVHDLAKVTCSC
jgi:hypothetical protein